MQNKWALILSNLLVNENFQIAWSEPISSLFSKRVHVLQKIITDEWVYFQYFLRYLRNFTKPTFSTPVRNFIKVSVGFQKGMARKAACLCQDLLISTLYAYDFEISSLNLLEDYLSNHKNRIKVDSFFSSWVDILSGVLQHFCSMFLCVPCSWYWRQSTLMAMQMIMHVL